MNIGDQIPNFTTLDMQGNPIQAEDLEGYPTILFFFEISKGFSLATLYNSYLGEFQDLEADVIGIYCGDRQTLEDLALREHLYFPLIHDQDLSLSHLFGVVSLNAKGKELQVETTTFLIDWDKTICWIERGVNMEGHLDRLVKALELSCG
jgi:thioredoxin-dependent peroxiredoxin